MSSAISNNSCAVLLQNQKGIAPPLSKSSQALPVSLPAALPRSFRTLLVGVSSDARGGIERGTSAYWLRSASIYKGSAAPMRSRLNLGWEVGPSMKINEDYMNFIN